MITSISSKDWLSMILDMLDEKDNKFNFASKQQEDFLNCECRNEYFRCDPLCPVHKRRSGEMADTSDLKSDDPKDHEGSSPSSGITLKAILDTRIKQYKELIKDPNHPYLIYLKELMRKYDDSSKSV